ncbi:hypothetical protein [Streptomyces umbrinus]|uniref:hypothetical protein n=1 Tax=Streptomyces umbrinus TaxID=67370 RepID=UPI00343DA6C9
MAIKRCTSSFVPVRGVPRVIKVGQLFNDDDPIIQGREHLFEDVEAHVQERTRVEQATAEPGRRRSLTRPTRKSAAPKASSKPKAEDKDPGASENPDAASTEKGTSS